MSATDSRGATTRAQLRDEDAAVAAITTALGPPSAELLCGRGPGYQYIWGEPEDNLGLFYGTNGWTEKMGPDVIVKAREISGVRIENEIGISVGDPLSDAPAGSYEATYEGWTWHDFGVVEGTQYGAIMWTDQGNVVTSFSFPSPGWGRGICT